MARVTKCDICGDDINGTDRFKINGTDRFKIKGFLLKKKEFDWDGVFWRKIDICNECQVNIIYAARARKGTFISDIDGKTYRRDKK